MCRPRGDSAAVRRRNINGPDIAVADTGVRCVVIEPFDTDPVGVDPVEVDPVEIAIVVPWLGATL